MSAYDPHDAGDARRYLYRLPRFNIDLRLDFEASETVFLGVSRNLSGSGLLAEFDEPLPVGMSGLLTMYRHQASCAVYSVIDGTDGLAVRISFQFRDERERKALEMFLRYVQDEGAQIG